MKKIVYLLVLTLLLAGGVFAQKTSRTVIAETVPVEVPVYPADPLDRKFKGNESAAPTFDVLNNMYWGNAFALVTDDKSNSTVLSVSFDYTPNMEQPGDNQVTGGSWTLTVYQNGDYVGTIYGNVSDGVIVETTDETTGSVSMKSVKAHFIVTGGMGLYENIDVDQAPQGDYSSLTDYFDGGKTNAVLTNIL
jgi:hypothetical protein